MNIMHLRSIRSRLMSGNSDLDTKTVNWMLQDFPEWLKHECKQKALSQRQTLKDFVIEVLKRAVATKR